MRDTSWVDYGVVSPPQPCQSSWATVLRKLKCSNGVTETRGVALRQGKEKHSPRSRTVALTERRRKCFAFRLQFLTGGERKERRSIWLKVKMGGA